MIRSGILVTLLFVSSTIRTANAAEASAFIMDEKTTICEGYDNIPLVSLQTPVAADCSTFNSFDSWISDMNHYAISNAKPFLNTLVASNFNGWNWGEENWFVGSIYVFLKPGDQAWMNSQKYIFAHEMGHSFLQAYFSEHSPLFAKILELQKASAKELQQLVPILAMKNSNPSCKDPKSECGLKVSAAIKATGENVEGASADQKLKDFLAINKSQVDRFLEVASPYHELFADVFEAIYAADPEINNKAFLGIGVNEEPCRTFNTPLDHNFRSNDPHCSLSSIRVDLWNKVLQPSAHDKSIVLLKVADAMWAEIETQLDPNAKVLDSSEAEKRLLARLNY